MALSRRHDLPARVRALLDGVFRLCHDAWPRLLEAAVAEFEHQLFAHADKSRSDADQQECFDTLKKVARARAELVPRFLAALEDSLARFDEPVSTASHGGGTDAPGRDLALVDHVDFEESLVLQDMAVKADIRQTMSLYMLGHRFGVLAALPALGADTLPIGPRRLGAALRHAAAPLDIPIAHRVLLYQTFDRVAMPGLGSFYDTVNGYLIEQRVLSHLRVVLGSTRPATPRTVAENGTPAQVSPPAPTPWPPVAPAPAPRARFVAAPPAAPAMPAATPSAAQRAQSQAPAADERDTELFAMLRELLAGRRHATGAPHDEPRADGYVPSGMDVQSVLGILQAKPITPVLLGGRVVPRAVSQLKHDLLAHLRHLAPIGTNPHLASEDSDTIDLVGLLFDRIMQDIKPNGATQTMLTKLQVPLLRVALSDKSFFTRRAHPARQLLNTIAETGTRWADAGESDADRALVGQMQRVIERVTTEFDGELGLIEELLEDLSRHMRMIARKAEASERRHVNAAKGREKLSLARQAAGAAIAERIAAVRPGPFLRTLLEQAWTDVLALTLLRHGEQSEEFRKQLEVVDKLVAAAASAKSGSPGAPSPALRARISSSLSEVGFDKGDIQNVVKHLFVPTGVEDDDGPSRTEVALRLKKKAHLGTEAAQEAPRRGVLPRAPRLDLNAEEQRMVERLKTVPFGTWFAFVVNQQGDSVRRKLSWYSPVTGHCLFVNQRGVRGDDRSIEQLARDLVRGRAHFVEPEQESLVDRAWKAIVASLKQLAGRAAPAPA
jgi:hypothetical protein